MKRTSRIKMAVTGLSGLLLVGGGASPAMAWGDGPFGADGDTHIRFYAGFVCEGRARTCINGPVNSGNTKDSQNVRLNGNPSNSGSPTNNSGSVNSGSTGTGAASGSSNHQQHIGPGGDLHL
ncbi:hypothetical protein AB0H73_33645 [Streptomyces olivoreticuli]|uniref:hypothetical protein n=1 Tax=Streptomyces olivoreticuli TaxID=68246 RepID=UPI001F0856F7|nr:hypothetical protein [Streptomyces olivoreticuli]